MLQITFNNQTITYPFATLEEVKAVLLNSFNILLTDGNLWFNGEIIGVVMY